MRRPFLALALLGGLLTPAQASDLAWLGLDFNARSAALGGCGVAIDMGSDSVVLNPATLSDLPGWDLHLLHNQWIDDTSFEHLSLGFPLSRVMGGGLFFDHANLGPVQGTRVGNGGQVHPTNLYQPRANRLGAGLGVKRGAGRLGASFAGVFERGFTQDQDAMVWTLGALWAPSKGRTTLGLVVSNASGEAATDDRELEVRPGAALRLGEAKGSLFLVSLEGVFGGEEVGTALKTGLEVAYRSRLFLRGGVRHKGDDATSVGARGLTAGLGWKSARIQLDYAFAAMGPLGSGHRLSLRWTYPTKHEPTRRPAREKKSTAPKKKAEKSASPASAPSTLRSEAANGEEGMMDRYEKGIAAYRSKRYTEAVRHLKAAVDITDPTVKDFYYAEAYSTLGLIYHDYRTTEGHLGEARKFYEKALAIDPETDSARKGLERLDRGE